MEFTRRGMLATLSFPLLAQEKPVAAAPEWRRYADPATEFDVIRLTDPQWESVLPAPPGRAVDRRSRGLLYSTDRPGAWQPFWMELSNGLNRPLGSFSSFVPESLTLSGDDREAWFQEGQNITAVQTSSLRRRDLASVRDGWRLKGALSASDDSTHLFYAEEQDGGTELRRLRLPKGAPETVTAHEGKVDSVMPNPKRATLLWMTETGELWVVSFDGSSKRKLETNPGKVLEAHWAPDGQSVLYLFAPEQRGSLNEIREQGLDTRADTLVSRTSQFGSFGRNANASVFVGASLSKASPMVLVLLRATRREFTLCEHRSSTPQAVQPRFTPNSQRVIFESDRHGKRAIYMLNVEKLIEKTDT